MPAPFARLQARLNAATRKHLANAVARVGGVDVSVEFNKPYAPAFDGDVDARAPECWGAEEDLGGLARFDRIDVDGIPYQVMTAEPDGAGNVHLVLGAV